MCIRGVGGVFIFYTVHFPFCTFNMLVHVCYMHNNVHVYHHITQVYNGPDRKARISLDVDAEGPILLIPKHAFSPELMVGDIGHVRVTNSSRYDGEPGTIAFTRRQKEAGQVVGDKSLRRADDQLLRSSTSGRAMSLSARSPLSYSSYSKLFDRGFAQQQQQQAAAPRETADAVRTGSGPSMFGPLKSFGSMGRRPSSSSTTTTTTHVIDEELEMERKVEARGGPCLLDCIEMNLTEVDVFSAKREQMAAGRESFRIVRQVS